jgi:hypothetical protein
MFDPFDDKSYRPQNLRAPRRAPLMIMVPLDMSTSRIRKYIHDNNWDEQVSFMKTCGPYYVYTFDQYENLTNFKYVPRECDADGWEGIIIVDIYPK